MQKEGQIKGLLPVNLEAIREVVEDFLWKERVRTLKNRVYQRARILAEKDLRKHHYREYLTRLHKYQGEVTIELPEPSKKLDIPDDLIPEMFTKIQNIKERRRDSRRRSRQAKERLTYGR